jgi:hypothetical protein
MSSENNHNARKIIIVIFVLIAIFILSYYFLGLDDAIANSIKHNLYIGNNTCLAGEKMTGIDEKGVICSFDLGAASSSGGFAGETDPYWTGNSSIYINKLNDTLGDGYLYKINNTGTLNVSALDNRFGQGGSKSFYFTNHTSDILGMYNTSLSLIDMGTGASLTQTANDGINTLFGFLSEPEPEYVVASGTRTFHIVASASSESTPVYLRGLIYITNLTGGNKTLLRNSTLSLALTTVKTEYQVTAIGGVVVINADERILFEIQSEKSIGSDPDVTIYLEDEDLSRLDVPSPVVSTDLNGYAKYNFTDNSFNGSGNFATTGNITGNSFYTEMWFYNRDSPYSINLNTTYQKINNSNQGDSNGFLFHSSNSLELMNSLGIGEYSITWRAFGLGSQNHVYEGFVYVNEIQKNDTVGIGIGQASNAVRLEGTGYIRLNKYDNITIRLADTSGTSTVTAYNGNVRIERIGN